ncbi:hypothetical protein QTP70_013016, partial [Hemibagrus guttatus]
VNSKMEAKCFRDIRDVIFGLSDEDWRAVSRDLSYKFTKLELAILCSTLVKILSSLVIECVLPSLIDAVGLEAVLCTEIKLRENGDESRSGAQGSPENPSDYVSSFIRGLVSQVREAMKRTLMKFSSVKTSKPKIAEETLSECPLIDDLTASSTKAIITEIVRLCYPDVYSKMTEGKKPERFQQVINIIVKAMMYIENIQRCSSTSDSLGESADEKITMSGGGEEDVFSEHVRTKAVHVISSILHEASEEVASVGSGHPESLDEITILPSSNKLLPAACETYSCVQKKVCRFLLKVQASVSPKEESCVKRELHQLTSGSSSSKCSSERVSVSATKAVKANVCSTSALEEERLCLDTCTDEIIANILDFWTESKERSLRPTSSGPRALTWYVMSWSKTCILLKKQKRRKSVRSVFYRKLSRDLIRYLESAASDVTHSVTRELEECLEAESRNKTQTGLSRASNTSASNHTDIFAPFRLFGHVRNDMENIFSTIKDGRWSNKSTKMTSANNETTCELICEIMITEDGTVVERSSSDHGHLSRGFAGCQAGNMDSAVNQLKSLLSRDSGIQRHESTIANAVSTILRNMTASSKITRKFSPERSALTEERSRGIMFGARGISQLVHGFVPELITHLDCYFSSTEFNQIAAQTESCKGELTANDEKAFAAAVRELAENLTDFAVESAATPTRKTRKSKTLDELNAHSQQGQLTALDDEFSHPSIQGSGGKKKKKEKKKGKITIPFTDGQYTFWTSDPEKGKKSKIESCSSSQQEVHFWDEQNGKGRELADMMERRKVDILCVQETRWKGSKARSIGAGFKLFYYGVDSKRNGVGVVLKEEFVRNVLEVKRVSDRVMSLKLEIEGVMLNVVSGYAPQVGCELEEKERFWSELDEVMESIPTGERVVIGADFNGHVGEGNTGDEEVMGMFGVKERNLEGQMVVDFAKRMDMAVVNTYFQKREEHRVTYKSGGRSTQVDYILCRRGNLKEISDCKMAVGESVARQHRMVVCRMTLLVCKMKRLEIEIEKKTKWWKLKKEECCEEFRLKLRQALGGQVVLPDDWETTAEVIRETGRKVLGVSSGRRKEDKETWWWNEEVQDSIQRKRLAKKKWDMDRTEENRQEYKELQHRVKREVSKAKQKAYEELYTKLDTREGEKDLYRLARQRDRDGKDVQQVRVIKDRDGRVLTSEESVQRRWKEYFEELMNEENEREKRVEVVNSVEQKVDKIRKDEVRKALKRMKCGKAVGPDDIPVEVWKCLGEAAVEFLTSLFNRVLESERMPEEWRRSVLVPIFKNKGDVQSCSNYRGIKLMSHTMKLWERVVEASLRKVVEICEQQYGFMPRKSTTDAIFALRILMEKYRDGQRELHCVFVDLEKAYDRVPREELWYCMRKSGVAEKYVRVVQDMYERSRTALSEEVRQESSWTMMFADDIVICSESREQVEENLERWRFALERRGMKVSRNDIVICSESREQVEENLERWRFVLERRGMKVSRSKTEYMCVNEREGSGTVRLQGEEVKKVQEFKYLGSTVQSNGESGKEVKKRVQAGWNGWRKVSGVLCDRNISARIKGKVYRTVVRPAMLYGLETVSLKKRQESELEVAELKMLRFSLGVTRLDRIRNEYIRGTAHVGRLGDKVREAKLRWFGHVQRRERAGDWVKAELRSFLGFASYYRRFVEGFAKIAAPLHRLAAEFSVTKVKPKKRVGLEFIEAWSEQCQTSFEELKISHTDESLKYFESFQVQDDDVIVITYPKSGTSRENE